LAQKSQKEIAFSFRHFGIQKALPTVAFKIMKL